MDADLKNQINTLVDSFLPEVIEARHELHQFPELRWEEKATSHRIKNLLSEIPHLSKPEIYAKHGMAVMLEGTCPGPTIALRADMDGLPIQERTGVAWQSQNAGVMHACGHDGHMANLLGAAKVLSRMRDKIRGRVKFIFQPAEEGGHGAKVMCEEGVLKDVDVIFGLHGLPEARLGTVLVRSGAMLASTSELFITIQGRGSHAAYPHRGTDQVLIGCRIVEALQSIVSRGIAASQSAVISITTFHAGTANNVIPDAATLTGTLRTLDMDTREQCVEQIHRIVNGIAATFGITADVKIVHGYPVTMNHEKEAHYVARTAESALGKTAVLPFPNPSMGGEDFSYFLQHKPGAYFFLGLNDGGPDSLHHPEFDFNDKALKAGMTMFTSLVLNHP